jgi:hypothetical protein
VQVLVFIAIIGFAAAAWEVFKEATWWEPVALVSAVVGFAALVPYVIGVRQVGDAGDAGVQMNIAIHAAGSRPSSSSFWCRRCTVGSRCGSSQSVKEGPMKARPIGRGVFDALSGLPLFATAPLYRRWHLRWGATDEEVRGPMPGDEIVPKSSFCGTRAITVDAPPEMVWPWIVQVGYRRAGFYTLVRLPVRSRPLPFLL